MRDEWGVGVSGAGKLQWFVWQYLPGATFTTVAVIWTALDGPAWWLALVSVPTLIFMERSNRALFVSGYFRGRAELFEEGVRGKIRIVRLDEVKPWDRMVFPPKGRRGDV